MPGDDGLDFLTGEFDGEARGRQIGLFRDELRLQFAGLVEAGAGPLIVLRRLCRRHGRRCLSAQQVRSPTAAGPEALVVGIVDTGGRTEPRSV